MSSRSRRELEQGAVAVAAGGVAAWWWWHTYSLRQLIEQYEKGLEECSYQLSQQYRKHQATINDSQHVDRKAAMAEGVRLTNKMDALKSKFMLDLKAMAHMPVAPPAIDHEAAI